MKAMILAAGLGTRLKPLTDSRPKALVELSGRTLLEITIQQLKSFGVTELIVNVHHFADMVVDYLKSKNNFGLRIELSREEVLLDTGGGLKKAAWFFLEDSSATNSRTQNTGDSRQGTASAVPKSIQNSRALAPEAVALAQHASFEASSGYADEPFILHNVDVISNIDLARMLQFHKTNHALATLAVQHRPSSRQLLFNNQLQLVGRLSSPHAAPELISSTGTPVYPEPAERACALPPTAPTYPSTSSIQSADPVPNCHPEQSEGSAFSSGSPLVFPEGIRGATHHSFIPKESEGPLAFSGVHIISPRLLPMITETGIFSIIPTYLRLAAQNQKILAFRADSYYWRDLGRPSDLAQAALDLRQNVSL
jgi:NDP-sugar pyrophosphorylase family protein